MGFNKDNIDINNLPEEYINLVKEAMESNITKEEFKNFLKDVRKRRKKFLS